MKVYIVTDGCYSDYYIEAVFTDEKKAKEYAALHNFDSVEEFEADDKQIDGEIDVYNHYHFYVLEEFGDLNLEGKSYTSIKHNEVRRSNISRAIDIYVSLKEEDEDKAEKIAQDMYAQWKYEQSEGGINL